MMFSDLLNHISESADDGYYYDAFGEFIQTDHQLENLLPARAVDPTLKFISIKDKHIYFDDIDHEPSNKFSGLFNLCIGVNRPITIYRYDDGCLARLSDLADFYIYDKNILFQQIDPGNTDLIDIFFLGMMCSLWFELRGIAALHASAIELNNSAVAFLSVCQSGKSTLAASFMRSGYPLMTDDVLPIERSNGSLLARPGYPQMKMWPQAALHFIGPHIDLKLVDPNDPLYNKIKVPVGANGFGSFCNQRRPLAAIYLPFRQQDENSEIKIDPVSPGDAIIELIRYSFIARVVDDLGLQADRFRFFARLVKEVPVRRLTYPTGFHNLDRVQDAILDDLSGIKAPS